MKTFNVYYDVVLSSGLLEEKVLTVSDCDVKTQAINAFRDLKCGNKKIFRSVKSVGYSR